MNISPGPRIIIRNEIALESLINHRAANAVALGMREPQVSRRRRLRFFRVANHRRSGHDKRYLLRIRSIFCIRFFKNLRISVVINTKYNC